MKFISLNIAVISLGICYKVPQVHWVCLVRFNELHVSATLHQLDDILDNLGYVRIYGL